jgi:hypothetical protein
VGPVLHFSDSQLNLYQIKELKDVRRTITKCGADFVVLLQNNRMTNLTKIKLQFFNPSINEVNICCAELFSFQISLKCRK